jgi:nucleoside-diphosphate-sugar epimerase
MGEVEPFSSPDGHKFFASERPAGVHVGLNSLSPEILAGKRLVVFGCGYVGTAVALEAQARGLAVTALTRNTASAVVLREQGMETVVADLADESWHEQVPATPDFALNCVSGGGGGLDDYQRSYVRGMESIVRWAEAAGSVGTLVYTSSTSVYPQGGGGRIDESAPTEEAGERGQVLLAAERALSRAQGVANRWFILRLAGIYGPGRHYLLDPSAPRSGLQSWRRPARRTKSTT